MLTDEKGQLFLAAALRAFMFLIVILIIGWVFIGTGLMTSMSQAAYNASSTSVSQGDLSNYYKNPTTNSYIGIVAVLFGIPIVLTIWYAMKRDTQERRRF